MAFFTSQACHSYRPKRTRFQALDSGASGLLAPAAQASKEFEPVNSPFSKRMWAAGYTIGDLVSGPSLLDRPPPRRLIFPVPSGRLRGLRSRNVSPVC